MVYEPSALPSWSVCVCVCGPVYLLGAEWEAHHRSGREEALGCLRVRGQQHRGSEGEQGGSPLRAGWDHAPLSLSPAPTMSLINLWTAQGIRKFLFSSAAAKPALVLKPDDVSVRTGESAQFYCQAKGDPPPAVAWSREQGPLPNGRYFILPIRAAQ